MKNKTAFYVVVLIILVLIVIICLALLQTLPQSQNLVTPVKIATTTENAPFSNTTEEGYSSYVNNKYGFSIFHPTSLKEVDLETVGYLDDLDNSDIFVAKVPDDTFKGTNLSDVTIIAGAKTTDQNTCFNIIGGGDIQNDASQKMNVKINGIDFVKIKVGDAGAGNFYDTTRYSTYKNGICYELLAVAHSLNLDIAQEMNPSIKQYADSLFMPEFEEIVSSFKYHI